MRDRGKITVAVQGPAPRSVKEATARVPPVPSHVTLQEAGSQDPLHVTPGGRDPWHVMGGWEPGAQLT